MSIIFLLILNFNMLRYDYTSTLYSCCLFSLIYSVSVFRIVFSSFLHSIYSTYLNLRFSIHLNKYSSAFLYLDPKQYTVRVNNIRVFSTLQKQYSIGSIHQDLTLILAIIKYISIPICIFDYNSFVVVF